MLASSVPLVRETALVSLGRHAYRFVTAYTISTLDVVSDERSDHEGADLVASQHSGHKYAVAHSDIVS